MNIEELKNKAEQAWFSCDGCSQDDKQMWINGYLVGALSNQNELPSDDEIENAIIKWVIDGTKTAGSLTREIMSIIEQQGNG